MINKNDTRFLYDPDTHVTTCIRTVKNKRYFGRAQCHPHDYDFESKLVGEHYAYTRSMVNELAESRDQARLELKALHHLYSLYKNNPRVDLNSYECSLLRRQIKAKEKEISHTRDVIRTAKANLRAMIAIKDQFYKSVREERAKKNESKV